MVSLVACGFLRLPSHGQGNAHVQISRLVGNRGIHLSLSPQSATRWPEQGQGRQRIKRCVFGFDKRVSRYGLVIRQAGKRKDLGSIPLRLSFLFKSLWSCGHCLVTLFLTTNETLKWLSSLPILMQVILGGDSE